MSDWQTYYSVARFIFAVSGAQYFSHAWPGILNFLEIKIQT
jgi:hypothetical protein